MSLPGYAPCMVLDCHHQARTGSERKKHKTPKLEDVSKPTRCETLTGLGGHLADSEDTCVGFPLTDMIAVCDVGHTY